MSRKNGHTRTIKKNQDYGGAGNIYSDSDRYFLITRFNIHNIYLKVLIANEL